LSLIREITKEIEDDALYEFIHLVIDELINGIKIENYKEVIKLDDYNLITPYLNKLNNEKLYNQMRQESNLLILGNISDDLLRLKDKQIKMSEIEDLLNYLLKTIKEKNNKENSILIGRAVWCLSKLICLVRTDEAYLTKIFNSVSQTMCDSKNSDLSIQLICAQ
jgi:phosphoenolpyruvate carboxylase